MPQCKPAQGFAVVREILIHEAFEVIWNRIAGIHLLQFRQEQITQRRLRGRHGPHIQPDERFGGGIGLLGLATERDRNERDATKKESKHGMTPGKREWIRQLLGLSQYMTTRR